MILFVSAYAQNTALFGTITGVSSDNMLNVRAQPNYKARKLGALPPNAYIGIAQCKRVGQSRWCHIYQITQNIYTDDFQSGWVNARFLKPLNRGYVLIEKRKNNCFYALQCREDRCEVVTGASYDDRGNIVRLQTEWMDRKYVRGDSRFGAASNDMDGYCTLDQRLEGYAHPK